MKSYFTFLEDVKKVRRIRNLTRKNDPRKSPYKLSKSATKRISDVLSKSGFDPIDALQRPENPIDLERRERARGHFDN